MTNLSVNLNKIALIRNARGRDYPNVNHFAKMALDGGASGITLHPRPDQRHARYDDVYLAKQLILEYPNAELNIEGNPKGKFLDVVIENLPHQCTLVPDEINQITSDHGWQLNEYNAKLFDNIQMLLKHNIRISLFMDPDVEMIPHVAQYHANSIELYTEDYARCFEKHEHDVAQGSVPKELKNILDKYAQCSKLAHQLGFIVNAGHDLNLQNLSLFLERVDNIAEVSIGHALTVEALHFGFEKTIQSYVKIVQ